MSWEAAFEAAVLDPLRRDAESAELWRLHRSSQSVQPLQRASARGQLAASDDRRRALWAAFRYQRYHADAMIEALRSYDTSIDRVCVDLGCGTGTVGVALHEVRTQRGGALGVLDYIGVDHNGHCLDLARALLGHPHYSDIGSVHLTTNLGDGMSHALDLLVHDTRRHPIVTMSYLLHQDSVDDAFVAEIALCITHLARSIAPRPVPVVITDRLALEHPHHERLIAHLDRTLAIDGSRQWSALVVPPRFPNLDPDREGWFARRPAAPTVHRWILRLRAT